MRSSLATLLALVAIAASNSAPGAADTPATRPAPAAEPEYPLKTCLVSDEPLSASGDFVAYTHREAGKPDIVVRLCCEGCIEDFRQNPPKFLKKLTDAQAAAAKNRKKS